MSAITSLNLYKRIKEGQRVIEYHIANGNDWYIAIGAREILSAFHRLEFRANTLNERSAVLQIRKLQKEL